MLKIISIFGTRPEAIKMAPVIKEIQKYPEIFESVVCVTAQHRQMLDQVLSLFEIKPDYDFNIMSHGQDLFDVTSDVLVNLRPILSREKPEIVLVHGDTTTTMAAALAAFYSKIKIGHVEAGLRTRNKIAPYPEEMNRVFADYLADEHFAPTEAAKQNLLHDGMNANHIHVTGNTVIDALFMVTGWLNGHDDINKKFDAQFAYLNKQKRLILVTGHRRENFGEGFENICLALADIAHKRTDVEILYPVHLNPNVRKPVDLILRRQGLHNVHLIEPVDYLPFVYLMNRSSIIVTDSGGVQEEAPSLGKPVLVMRDVTERPEAVQAGTVKLVGTNRDKIVEEIRCLLDEDGAYRKMSLAHNPYGDGKASEKIVNVLKNIVVNKGG